MHTYTRICVHCHEPFTAAGPKAAYCLKPECQAAKRKAYSEYQIKYYRTKSAHDKKTYTKPKVKPKPPLQRNCLGWCGTKFMPVSDEHFCPECDRKRLARGKGLYETEMVR